MQNRFRRNDRASYGREINRKVERMLSSCKMEEFSFAVFHDKTSIEEDFRHDIVATE